VRDIEGKTLTVGLDFSNDSISYLKTLIEESLGLKPENQRLTF